MTDEPETTETEDAHPDDEPLGEPGRRALEAERKARRDAEQRLQGLQRAEAERMAGGTLADPADLWREVGLSDLVDDAGELEPERVRQAVDQVASSHPHWRQRPRGSADAGRGEPADGRAEVDRVAERLIRGQ